VKRFKNKFRTDREQQ